jgi:hypothetical protein
VEAEVREISAILIQYLEFLQIQLKVAQEQVIVKEP